MAQIQRYDDETDTKRCAIVNLGTTISAVAFEGGVIVAADSRTSSGSYVVSAG